MKWEVWPLGLLGVARETVIFLYCLNPLSAALDQLELEFRINFPKINPNQFRLNTLKILHQKEYRLLERVFL